MTHSPTLHASALVTLLATLLLGAAPAQCEPAWHSVGSPDGADSVVRHATSWDPDGAGPAPARVVVVGDFTYIADTVAARLATWEPVTNTWAPLATVQGLVRRVAALANGDLVISGAIVSVDGVAVNGLARFDGTAWSPLPGGAVECMLALPNGDLLAARNVVQSGQWIGSIERWNGSVWSPFTSNVGGRVTAIAVLPNGALVAAGAFASAGGVLADNIAQWNGTAWSPLGSGLGGAFPADVLALAVLANGDVVAGGYFTLAGGQPVNLIARWNGATWAPLGSGVTGPPNQHVMTLCTLTNGDLIVGGYFNTAGGLPANCVARWNANGWSAVGIGFNNTVNTFVELQNGGLFAGGDFTGIASGSARFVARWNGTVWSAFGGGNPGPCDAGVWATAVTANGDLIAGGSFNTIGGIAANRIARRSGSTWFALGSGISGQVSSIAVQANGGVVVGGTFTQAGGVPAANIARWNGSTWSPLGSGIANYVLAVATLPNGDVLAGGSFSNVGGVAANNIARWDGTTWSALGAGLPFSVSALAIGANGEIFAAGASQFSGGRIDVWNGTSWSNISAPLFGSVSTLCVMPNGDLVAGGSFSSIAGTPADSLARWNGGTWSSLGLGPNTLVRGLGVLPNGDLLAAGPLNVGGVSAAVARRSAAGWIWSAGGANGVQYPATLTVLPQGEVAVGGSFTTIGTAVSPYFATLRATCPATAIPYGSGCMGSAGPNLFAATSLPWIGGTYRARATGIPSSSFVAVISGFTPLAVPLSVFLSEAGPSCLGYVTGDVLDIALPTAGSVTTQLAVPNQLALVGAQFHQYLVSFEFDVSGTLLAVTSSNALTVTAGAF